MVILNLTEKGGESKQLEFDKDEVTIGRVQGNDIVLPKGNVSKRHCRIFVANGKFSVEDAKSTNGTYVNGRKIPDVTPIFSNDKIYVGDFIVKVENAPSQEAASLGNEAGSLSSALGGRRPPPPPPGRPSQSMRAVSDEPAAPSEPRRTMSRPPAPPPPPPPRRDSAQFHAVPDEPPPSPADIDLDEDALATAPPRPTPPPPRAPTYMPPPPPPQPSVVPAEASEEREAVSTDAVTATKDRGTVPANVVSNPGDPAAWLRQMLANESITAVFIAGAGAVEVERAGRREPITLGGPEAGALVATLRSYASLAGAPGGANVVDAVATDGTRIVAVFPPVASEVAATLTKRQRAGRSLADLVSDGVMSHEMREVLDACVASRRNILVAGDAGATRTVLGALANAIPSRLRVVAVGAPVSAPNAGYTWTTVATEAGKPDVVRAAAALRADFLLADTGPLAGELIHECAYGQQGTLLTGAGRSATDALQRLEALVGPSAGTRGLIESTLDLVIHTVTLADGKVLVLDLAEPRQDPAGRLFAEPLATFKVEGAVDGKPAGRFAVTGTPCRLAATLAARGASVSATVLRR